MMKFSKMIEKVIGFLDKVQNIQHNLRIELAEQIKAIEKKILMKIIQLSLFEIGILLILAAGIVYASRFIATEIVLLGTGIIFLYIAFMMKVLNK